MGSSLGLLDWEINSQTLHRPQEAVSLWKLKSGLIRSVALSPHKSERSSSEKGVVHGEAEAGRHGQPLRTTAAATRLGTASGWGWGQRRSALRVFRGTSPQAVAGVVPCYTWDLACKFPWRASLDKMHFRKFMCDYVSNPSAAIRKCADFFFNTVQVFDYELFQRENSGCLRRICPRSEN